MVHMIWRRHREILIVSAVFLVIGLVFSLVVPVFEAHEEEAYFRYVRHIAEGRGLPLVPADVLFPQEHQAPLYFLLSGTLISPLDLSEPALPQRNPYSITVPGPIEDNRNAYYHTPDEAFPFRGTILAIYLGRLVSLAMGMLTVLATYAVAWELFSPPSPTQGHNARLWLQGPPAHKAIAIGAATINAFNPQFIYVASGISNDSTVAACSGWALFMTLRILRRGITWQRSFLLGGILGLTALSKLNGLAIFPIALLALAIAGARQRDLRLWFKHTLVVVMLASLIAGWWYVRNWVLYRDPFTLNLALERWGAGRPRGFEEILTFLPGIEVGFWGLFGHDNLLMDPFIYDVLRILDRLAVIGVAFWIIRVGVGSWLLRSGHSKSKIPENRRQTMESFWLGLGLVALTFVAALAGLYRWLQITDLPAGRYLYPAISAVSLLLFLGLRSLVPVRLTPVLVGTVGVGLLTLSAVTPFRYIAPAYTRPPLISSDETIPNRVHISYADHIELVGYEFKEAEVKPGDWLHITLYWQLIKPPNADLTVALRVFGRNDTIVGSKDTFPGLGRYPTSLWQPGFIVKDTYPIRIAADAKTPTRLSFDVSLYHQPTMFVLPKYDRPGSEIGRLKLGEAKLSWPDSKPGKPSGMPYFTLGEEIRLVGHSINRTPPYNPGSALDLTLYWEGLTDISTDYTVFVHLLNQDDQLVTSWDEPPVNGYYPTHLWSPGEVVEDIHRLTLPTDLPQGEYHLVLGLYQLDTLQRLPAFDAREERVPNDAVPLLTFSVDGENR
jgi:4-amino-4-deoxy-L-arabinose transferase-like glycosyltransferase